jgi:hypothetical protein
VMLVTGQTWTASESLAFIDTGYSAAKRCLLPKPGVLDYSKSKLKMTPG